MGFCSPDAPSSCDYYFYPGHKKLGWGIFEQRMLTFPNNRLVSLKEGSYKSCYYDFEGCIDTESSPRAFESGDTLTFFVDKRNNTIEVEIQKPKEKAIQKEWRFLLDRRFLLFGGREQRLRKKILKNLNYFEGIKDWPEDGLVFCISGFLGDPKRPKDRDRYEMNIEIMDFENLDQKKEEKERIRFVFHQKWMDSSSSSFFKKIKLVLNHQELYFLLMS